MRLRNGNTIPTAKDGYPINLSRLADAAERIALALEDGVELQARIHGISR